MMNRTLPNRLSGRLRFDRVPPMGRTNGVETCRERCRTGAEPSPHPAVADLHHRARRAHFSSGDHDGSDAPAGVRIWVST